MCIKHWSLWQIYRMYSACRAAIRFHLLRLYKHSCIHLRKPFCLQQVNVTVCFSYYHFRMPVTLSLLSVHSSAPNGYVGNLYVVPRRSRCWQLKTKPTFTLRPNQSSLGSHRYISWSCDTKFFRTPNCFYLVVTEPCSKLLLAVLGSPGADGEEKQEATVGLLLSLKRLAQMFDRCGIFTFGIGQNTSLDASPHENHVFTWLLTSLSHAFR